MALVDISITNQGNQDADIEVVPFLRSNQRGFHGLNIKVEESRIEFSHEMVRVGKQPPGSA